MFLRHVRAVSTWLPMMLLLAPEDAGAGSGGAAGGESGAPGDGATGIADGSDGDPAPEGDQPADGATGDDDLDDEDREREELLNALSPEEREKRIRTWNRRTSRQLRSLRPVAELLRDPRNGQLLPPDEVRRRLSAAEDMAELNALFEQHPDLVGEILKRRNGGGREAAAPKAAEYQDPYADANALPFDMEQEASRYLVDQLRAGHKERFDLRQRLEQLNNAVEQLTQGDQRRTLAQVEDHWKNQTLAAAKRAGLDERQTSAFVNSVYKTFRLAKAEKRLGRIKVAEILERELAPYKGQRRTVVTDQHRRAANAANAPRPGGSGQRTAATPNETNKTGTIRDARKSFFERLGQSAPPR
jgi:hypothetical protein